MGKDHVDDRDSRLHCINCELLYDSDESAESRFHCPTCASGMGRKDRTDQTNRWFNAGGGPTGPRFGDSWPLGFPEYRSLRKPRAQ